MTALDLVNASLRYRNGSVMTARFDLQAALDGVPGAVQRFGSDRSSLEEAIRLLGG